VFLLSLGFFVTPALLGGRSEQMLSMVIETQVNKILDWGFAAALSTLLLIATAVFASALSGIIWIVSRRLKTLEGTL
jgi:ABC-type spermidine/putrescine transport system permease subunit I